MSMVVVVGMSEELKEVIQKALRRAKDEDQFVSLGAFEALERAYEEKCMELERIKHKYQNNGNNIKNNKRAHRQGR